MATYTADDLKDLTSVSAVSTFSDTKILLYQSMAEATLSALNMDSSIAGYAEAYSGAVVLLFDAIAENPTGLRSLSQGRVSKSFSIDDLPGPVANLVRPYIAGSGGTMAGAVFQRSDIGLR
jgi:hypothetical protein